MTAGPAKAELDLMQRWFEALQAADPRVAAGFVYGGTGESFKELAGLGTLAEPAELLALARDAGARGKLQLASLRQGGVALVAPLRWPARPGAVAATVVAASLTEAGRFAATFQAALERLADALQPQRKPAPVPEAAARRFGAVEAMALLKSPNADSFAEVLYRELSAVLTPDAAALVEVRGNRLKVLRSSSRFDPLPRGGRAGHGRRVALLSSAASGKPVQVSWSTPGSEALASLDLGLLAAADGPQQAVAVTLPALHGKGQLVYLAEYLDRETAVPATPELAEELGSFAATLTALRRKGGRAKPVAPDWRWLWRLGFAAGAVAGIVWLCLPAPLIISGEATLSSTGLRSIVATRDGILERVNFEPGQDVRAGEVIAEFDTRELRLRANRIAAQLAQAERRKQSAVAGFKAAEIRVVDAEIEALGAERDLVGLLLEQSVVVAGADAIIVSGDMAERVGSALRQGEPMFQLAPLAGYTVSIEVAQQDVTGIAVGQVGELKLTAMPFENFAVEIERVSPAASEASATGAFSIRAALGATHPSFRPGMRGVVHITTGEAMRAWALTRDFWFWLGMEAWRWLP